MSHDGAMWCGTLSVLKWSTTLNVFGSMTSTVLARVFGGLGGVMEAACRGARSAGGTTVGILPGDDRTDANEFVDVAVATGMGEGRNALVVRTADAVIAVGGEFGTLSEIALALRAGKPVIGIGTWELASDGRPVEAIIPAGDAATAVDVAMAGLSGR